jgi:RimJ/RimL family protein N-acetyltransferase
MPAPPDVVWTGTLKNGSAATMRMLHPNDREKVAAAVRKLDPESIYTRLFSHRKELTEAGLNRIMHVEAGSEVVLIVTTGTESDEVVIGSGRYIASQEPGASGRTAEVAFLVAKDYQGLGIAGRLLAQMAKLARKDGIAAFEADVLAENKSMLAVFARSGLPMKKRYEGGTVHITLALEPAA